MSEQEQNIQVPQEFIEPQPDVQLVEDEGEEVVMLPPDRPSANSKMIKQTRERLHPIWDAPEGLGLERKKTSLIQINAMNPWKKGSMQKMWKDISTEVQKHPTFVGVTVPSWKTLQDTVEEWVKIFSRVDNKNKGKTGTDDEEHSTFDKLKNECQELKNSSEAETAETQQETGEEARTKKANAAGAVSLLDASAKGLKTKLDARKKGRKEFARLNDCELQMGSSSDEEETRRKKPRVSGGIAQSIELFVQEKAAARVAKEAAKEAVWKAKEARRAAKNAAKEAERKERWELEKAERLLAMEIQRKKAEQGDA
eukprot:gene6409-7679_t